MADKTPLDAPSTFRTIGIVNGRPRPKASTELPAPKQQQQQRQPQQGGHTNNGDFCTDTRSYVAETWQAWNRFWFTPKDPATLVADSIMLAGSLLFYTHLVWSFDLQAFLGPEGWLPVDFLRSMSKPYQGETGYAMVGLEPILLDQSAVAALVRASLCATGVFLSDDRAV